MKGIVSRAVLSASAQAEKEINQWQPFYKDQDGGGTDDMSRVTRYPSLMRVVLQWETVFYTRLYLWCRNFIWISPFQTLVLYSPSKGQFWELLVLCNPEPSAQFPISHQDRLRSCGIAHVGCWMVRLLVLKILVSVRKDWIILNHSGLN